MDLSIVIPVYNEVESLPHLQAAIHDAFTGLPLTWEVIYVDDGSRDGSPALLESLAAADPAHTRAVLFRRNFGQTAAMAAGVDAAGGAAIAFLDADLQNDPRDIPALLALLDDGVDVACGWRKHRQDTLLTRRLPSKIANGLIARITGVHLHDYGCTLKVFKREVITAFRLYGEMHRFLPAYASLVGAVIREAPVTHHARKYGKTKYGLGRTFRVLLDLCTQAFFARYAHKPMHLFGGCGLVGMGLGMVALLMGLLERWTTGTVAGVVLLAGGMQTLFFGLLAEVQMRTYYEAQDKRPYVIRRVVNPREGDGVMG